MNKLIRLLAVTLCVMGCLFTAGCGDEIKGDWIKITQSAMDGTEQATILHIETADNGDYLLSTSTRYYKHKSGNQNTTSAYDKEPGGDEIINFKDSFTKTRVQLSLFEKFKWNGNPLKIMRKYEWRDIKDNARIKMPKDVFAVKDGKLILQGDTYEKTDKNKLEKLKVYWKDNLKKQIGKEIKIKIFDSVDSYYKATVSKIIIIENGKEEIFE